MVQVRWQSIEFSVVNQNVVKGAVGYPTLKHLRDMQSMQ
jgi:hypothetical protein